MFDDVTAQRLERLERETSRRQWGSAIMTASQRGHLEAVASGNVSAGGDKALVDMLAERFDRLERKNERLEWQLTRLEHRQRLWKRACLASVVLMIGVLGAGSFSLGLFGRSSASTAATPARRHTTRSSLIAETSPRADRTRSTPRAFRP